MSAVLLLASLGSLPESAHTVAQAQAAGGTTVEGPAVWQPTPGDPTTGTTGPDGTVTVSQTTDLTDQVVHVSWSGFTPSADPGTQVPNFIREYNSSVLYPVRVYECRGLHPQVTDCYGSTLYGADPALGFNQVPAAGTVAPDFPSNMALALTHADGTGAADIEVWNSHQSPSLGCDPTHACSLVVEPNYGGDAVGFDAAFLGTPGGCDDHSGDADPGFGFGTASDNVMEQNDLNGNLSGEQCAWLQHVTIPLSFAPTPEDCKAASTDFKVQGLEMANLAMSQWRTGACQGTSPETVQYSAGGGEPQARAAFLSRSSNLDVALTAYPDTAPPPRPYVYAPLATTGISVVFVLDDATGRQIRQMRLNARLVAKMLTQSYTLVPPGLVEANQAGFASVAGNPECVFEDPEFLQLNPTEGGTAWPKCSDLPVPVSGVAPIVVGGTTDLVRQLTSWIASDPDAEGFLQGAPDPWGMHVDSFYLRPGFSGYPVDTLVPQDGTGTVSSSPAPGVTTTHHYKQEEWSPIVGGLGQVARNTLLDQPTCYSIAFNNDGSSVNTKCPSELVGQRAVFAVMDSGQAKAFGLPEAQLENAAGSFVGPTANGMQAAVADMPVDSATGTQLLPYGTAGSAYSKDADAYPLTTVQYAMLPTQGVPAAKAGKIAQFVRQVTSLAGGQVYGPLPGQLPPGFVDLTSSQTAQAQAAAQHVAAQDSTLPNGQVGPSSSTGSTSAGPSGTSTGGSGIGGTGSGGVGGAGGSSAGTGAAAGGAGAAGGAAGGPGAPLNAQTVASGRPNPDRAGLQRLLLPGLLVAGAVLLVGGPAALVLGGTGAGGRLRRSVGGVGAATRRGRRALTRRLRPGGSR
ncbi:hypothetical protein [Streptacidiphilus cavernicola]|uniref:PBP domain-containing protein n=1 Tax=Streptacidiphilus cavernicola TaxID=3342716 RepID=A0ABV6VTL4_9ACTN